jgi:hypothetical protein
MATSYLHLEKIEAKIEVFGDDEDGPGRMFLINRDSEVGEAAVCVNATNCANDHAATINRKSSSAPILSVSVQTTLVCPSQAIRRFDANSSGMAMRVLIIVLVMKRQSWCYFAPLGGRRFDFSTYFAQMRSPEN